MHVSRMCPPPHMTCMYRVAYVSSSSYDIYVSRYDGTLVYREKGIPQLFQVEQHGYQCFLYRKDTRALTLYFFRPSGSLHLLPTGKTGRRRPRCWSERWRLMPMRNPLKNLVTVQLLNHFAKLVLRFTVTWRKPVVHPPPPHHTHSQPSNHPHTHKRTHTNVLPSGNLYAVFRTLLCLHEGPRALYMLCIWKRTTVCTHTLTHTHHKQRICARIRAHTHTRSHAHLASQLATLVTFDEIENIVDVPPTHLINSTGRRVRRGR
jgi:hypothetical protein